MKILIAENDPAARLGPKLPTPDRKFIGHLSNPERVLVNFDSSPYPALRSLPRREQSISADKCVFSDKPQNDKYVFRLYVAGSTSRSSRAIRNIKAICEFHLKDLYEERGQGDQIMVARALIRQSPLQARGLIGDLSQTERVLVSLDLPTIPEDA